MFIRKATYNLLLEKIRLLKQQKTLNACKSKEDINIIVNKKLEDKAFVDKCLSVCICPNCGGNLNTEFFTADGGTDYECVNCEKTYYT